jgi:hypothetical protein
MQTPIALMVSFSGLSMKLADPATAIDLNPVFCSAAGCVSADARIMLTGQAIRRNSDSTY